MNPTTNLRPTSPQTTETTRPDRNRRVAVTGLVMALLTALVASTLTLSATPASAGVDGSIDGSACRVVTTAPEHRKLAGHSAEVERLYRALFLRSPESRGLSFWTRQLDNGRMTLTDVAAEFARSAEFTNRYGRLDNTGFVDRLYCNVMGRIDRGQGATYWRSQLAAGMTRAEVVLYFSQSPEFIRSSLVTSAASAANTSTPAAKPTPATKPTPTTKPAPTTAPTTTTAAAPKPEKSTSTTVSTETVSTASTGSTSTTAPTPTTTASADEAAPAELAFADSEPAPAAADAPTLVWADEFDRLDPDVWRKEHSTYGDGNGELQCYRPENVEVRNGALILRAKDETYTCPNGSTREVTSGMVRGKVDFDHGQRIEFRVKVNPADPDDQRGLWPALWASSWNGGGWPNGGEVDWLEYVGKEPTRSHHTIHYNNLSGQKDKMPKAIELGERFSDSWRIIAFDWTDDLVWYVDGVEVQRIPAAEVDATNNPFLESANAITQIKLNFALGGSWGGALGPTTIDAKGTTNFAIDYVRIYDLG